MENVILYDFEDYVLKNPVNILGTMQKRRSNFDSTADKTTDRQQGKK